MFHYDASGDQYKGSELLREEQNRMLEERISMLKEQIDGERKDSQKKLESVSKALDSSQRDLAAVEASKNELVRRYAVIEDKLADYEFTIEKLGNELDLERDQTRKVWEKDNEIQNRNVEIETKLAMKNAELARLEALLEKTKDQCTQKISQEVSLAERYQQEKFAEEKNLLVKQVDSLTERSGKMCKELQDVQIEKAKLSTDLKYALERLTKIEQDSQDALDCKQMLQSQLLAKNEDLDRVLAEKEQYCSMIEQRNHQFHEISIAFEKASQQRDERERQVLAYTEQVHQLEERLQAANNELNRYQQETASLHQTREEFDMRIREMEKSLSNHNKKIKSKEKKLRDLLQLIADGDAERARLQEMLEHERENLKDLENQLRNAESECKEAKRDTLLLAEECKALKSVIKGQEGEMQKEINNLLNKVKATEYDYKLTRKALRSKEHVHKQASDVANKLQIELTDQRKYADDLRSRIRWLEDSNDALKRDKQSLEEHCEQLRAELDQRSQAGETYDHLLIAESNKTCQLQQKIIKLEEALKESVSKCASLQEDLEKSEQDLCKLKLQHKLEVKEIERSRERAASPTKLVPHNEQQEGVLASELKSVLTDMKSLISSAKENNKRGHFRSQSSKTKSERSSHLDMTQSDSTEYRRKSPPRGTNTRSRSSTRTASTGNSNFRALENTADKYKPGSQQKHRGVSEPLKTEAELLCRNLERKLEQLTRMGEDVMADKLTFARKKEIQPTSYEKLHKYLRSQASS